MATRDGLLKVRARAGALIRASEKWEQSYTKDRKTFRALIDKEQALEQAIAEHFYKFADDRTVYVVNWAEVQNRIQAAADVVPPRSDDIWNLEVQLLTAAIEDDVIDLITIGGQAGESVYESPLGISRISKAVQDAARKHVAQLVSGVTDTTRDLVRQAVKRSIAAGENLDAMTANVREVISNPVRAELIARTESVNSYQLGLEVFGQESGAVSRTWEARLNACVVCSPLDGVTKPVGEPFDTSVGPVLRPAVHPRCRCGLIYNY